MGLSIRKTTKKKKSANLNKWNLSSLLLFLEILLLLIMQYVRMMFVRYEIKHIKKLNLLPRKLICAMLQISFKLSSQMKKSFIPLNFNLSMHCFQHLHKQFDVLEDIKCTAKYRIFLSLQLRTAC